MFQLFYFFDHVRLFSLCFVFYRLDLLGLNYNFLLELMVVLLQFFNFVLHFILSFFALNNTFVELFDYAGSVVAFCVQIVVDKIVLFFFHHQNHASFFVLSIPVADANVHIFYVTISSLSS